MLDYLQLYPQTIELVKRYKEDQRCRLYEAMAFYAFTGQEPTWPEDAPEWLIWEALKQTVDRADKKVSQNKRNASSASRKEESESEPERPEANRSETERTEAKPSETDNHKPKTINQETMKKEKSTPPKPPAEKADDDFSVFWMAYPKKQDKQKAMMAWKKLNPDAETQRKMILAIQAQRASPQWQKDDGQFIPMPSTWLNGRRWEDQPTQVLPGKRVSAQCYTQREYTEEELDTGPDLIEEARALELRRLQSERDPAENLSHGGLPAETPLGFGGPGQGEAL